MLSWRFESVAGNHKLGKQRHTVGRTAGRQIHGWVFEGIGSVQGRLLGHRDELQSIAGTKPSPLLEVDPLSSNGRTVVFGAIYRGSNPCDGARY